MKKYTQMMKPGDLVIVLVMLLLTAGSYMIFVSQPAHGEGDLIIEARIGGEMVYSEPLRSENAPYEVSIPLPRGGEAVLSVTEDSVRVLPMPDWLCPRKICSHVFGEISNPGQNIICVPNRLVIELVGLEHPDVDGITR